MNFSHAWEHFSACTFPEKAQSHCCCAVHCKIDHYSIILFVGPSSCTSLNGGSRNESSRWNSRIDFAPVHTEHHALHTTQWFISIPNEFNFHFVPGAPTPTPLIIFSCKFMFHNNHFNLLPAPFFSAGDINRTSTHNQFECHREDEADEARKSLFGKFNTFRLHFCVCLLKNSFPYERAVTNFSLSAVKLFCSRFSIFWKLIWNNGRATKAALNFSFFRLVKAVMYSPHTSAFQ